jgi:hypothetical protein
MGLIPTDDESRAVLRRMGEGECAEVSISRSRSYQWHKMYKGICRDIAKNEDPERHPDDIDDDIRVYAGHYRLFWVDGHECRMPKRIAFDRLTADEWAELWPSLDLAIREHFGDEYIGESQKTGTW